MPGLHEPLANAAKTPGLISLPLILGFCQQCAKRYTPITINKFYGSHRKIMEFFNDGLPYYYDGRPYYSLNTWLKQKFGTKVYKLALDGGMGCPNRDGTLGKGGCIFAARAAPVILLRESV